MSKIQPPLSTYNYHIEATVCVSEEMSSEQDGLVKDRHGNGKDQSKPAYFHLLTRQVPALTP